MLYAVLDQEGGSAVGQVTFEIRPINDPPTIEPPAQTVFIPGEDVSLPLEYDDVDDDRASLVVRVRRLPPGLAFDQDAGRIVGRVDEDAAGDYAGMIRVSDAASTTTLDVTWVVMPEAHNGFSLSAATEARGVMLELNAPPGFDLVCYQLFRQNVDEEAPAWTPVTPEVTSEPEGNGPIRLLDASLHNPDGTLSNGDLCRLRIGDDRVALEPLVWRGGDVIILRDRDQGGRSHFRAPPPRSRPMKRRSRAISAWASARFDSPPLLLYVCRGSVRISTMVGPSCAKPAANASCI